LPLIETAETGSFDGRDVDEHIFAAALRLNEPISLLRVEPLHGTFRHICSRQVYQQPDSFPQRYPQGMQQPCKDTLLIVYRHSCSIMTSDQLRLGHPNERDRQGQMDYVLKRYQFRIKLI
jgi:hypothetical protein